MKVDSVDEASCTHVCTYSHIAVLAKPVLAKDTIQHINLLCKSKIHKWAKSIVPFVVEHLDNCNMIN